MIESEAMLRIERAGPVAVLRLARPPANALNLALGEQATAAIDALTREPSPPALLITGEGRFFSAGIDLKEVPFYSPDDQRRMVGMINAFFHALYGYARPVVAAVNGHALGGGLVIALAADYRVATSEPCKVGLREVRVGVPFPVSAFEVVAGELGPGAARRIGLLARDLDPAQALAEGAFDELKPPDTVFARAIEVATELAALPAAAYAITKCDLRRAALARMADAIATGKDPLLVSWLSSDTEGASRKVLDRGAR